MAYPEFDQQVKQRLVNRMGGNTGIVGPQMDQAPAPPPPPGQGPTRQGMSANVGPARQAMSAGAPNVGQARQAMSAPGAGPNMASAYGGAPSGGGQPFQREQFRDAWMGTGSDANAQNALLSQHGLRPDGAGRVTLPTGEVIDLRLGARAGGTQATWTGVDGGGAKIGQAGGGGGGGGYGAGPGGGGAPGAGGGPGGGFQDQIRSLLMSQLQGLSKPITDQDPAIAGELQSQERGAERARQERRAAMAERAAQSGLLAGGASSGAFDADVASGFEDKANRLSDVRSQLFGRELQNRRGQLAQMMNMALQSGDAESARALQLQLGQMDNELRRLGIQEGARQFDDSFGLQAGRFAYEKDRDLAQFGAGGF